MPQQARSTCSAEYLLLQALGETNAGSWPFTLLDELCSVLVQGEQSSCGSHWEGSFEGLVESWLIWNTWCEMPCIWSPVPMRQQHVWKLLSAPSADQTREGCSWATFLFLQGIFVDRFIVQSQLYAVSLWRLGFLYIKTKLFQIFQNKAHFHKSYSCLIIFHRKIFCWVVLLSIRTAAHGTNMSEKGWWIGDAGLGVLGFNIYFFRGKVRWWWSLNSGNMDCPQLYKLSALCPERGTKWATKEQRDGDG